MNIFTKKKTRWLIFYIILIIVLGVITELIPQLTGALTKTEILQYENMQITDLVTCYFVRDEIVHMAPNSGDINYYIEDGVKVRKNAKILDIAPHAGGSETSKYADIVTRLGSSDVTLTQMNSSQNGIVCYYVDGYEGLFTPEKMSTLTFKDIENLKLTPINLTRKTTLAGEPLFKICQSNYWNIIAWVDPENISKYEVGNTVKVDLPMGQIKASVDSIMDQGDKWLVIMKTTRYYEDFARIRSAEANIITQDYSGIKVRNSSIATEDGIAGVYIKSKNGEFIFKPVKIITSDGDFSLVSVSKFYDAEGQEVSTVDIYDEILKNPGQELKESKEKKESDDSKEEKEVNSDVD